MLKCQVQKLCCHRVLHLHHFSFKRNLKQCFFELLYKFIYPLLQTLIFAQRVAANSSNSLSWAFLLCRDFRDDSLFLSLSCQYWSYAGSREDILDLFDEWVHDSPATEPEDFLCHNLLPELLFSLDFGGYSRFAGCPQVSLSSKRSSNPKIFSIGDSFWDYSTFILLARLVLEILSLNIGPSWETALSIKLCACNSFLDSLTFGKCLSFPSMTPPQVSLCSSVKQLILISKQVEPW